MDTIRCMIKWYMCKEWGASCFLFKNIRTIIQFSLTILHSHQNNQIFLESFVRFKYETFLLEHRYMHDLIQHLAASKNKRLPSFWETAFVLSFFI